LVIAVFRHGSGHDVSGCAIQDMFHAPDTRREIEDHPRAVARAAVSIANRIEQRIAQAIRKSCAAPPVGIGRFRQTIDASDPQTLYGTGSSTSGGCSPGHAGPLDGSRELRAGQRESDSGTDPRPRASFLEDTR
jgi:hypothetical protein